ncbi:MAG: TPM domain-containing protein [Candidatus Cloacimonadaceae bacterium]|nr:TPM domain-containing protein [Candidatus Cloacimonadaceae bacterium]MDP3114281.1 TPM domain-containing protein [Candidatus Cloacimonadaceae bacterium]
MKCKIINVIFAVLLLIALSLRAVDFPRPVGFVNDFAGLLSEETKTKINDWAIELKEKTDVEFSIATFETLGGMAENEFAVKLIESWKIGNKDDEGVLILLGLKERRLRIEPGYGSEPYIVDAFADEVYRVMRDFLKPGSEDWNQAFIQGSLMLMDKIAREKGVQLTGTPQFRSQKTGSKGSPIPGIIIFFVFVFLMIVPRGRILYVFL